MQLVESLVHIHYGARSMSTPVAPLATLHELWQPNPLPRFGSSLDDVLKRETLFEQVLCDAFGNTVYAQYTSSLNIPADGEEIAQLFQEIRRVDFSSEGFRGRSEEFCRQLKSLLKFFLVPRKERQWQTVYKDLLVLARQVAEDRFLVARQDERRALMQILQAILEDARWNTSVLRYNADARNQVESLWFSVNNEIKTLESVLWFDATAEHLTYEHALRVAKLTGNPRAALDRLRDMYTGVRSTARGSRDDRFIALKCGSLGHLVRTIISYCQSSREPVTGYHIQPERLALLKGEHWKAPVLQKVEDASGLIKSVTPRAFEPDRIEFSLETNVKHHLLRVFGFDASGGELMTAGTEYYFEVTGLKPKQMGWILVVANKQGALIRFANASGSAGSKPPEVVLQLVRFRETAFQVIQISDKSGGLDYLWRDESRGLREPLRPDKSGALGPYYRPVPLDRTYGSVFAMEAPKTASAEIWFDLETLKKELAVNKQNERRDIGDMIEAVTQVLDTEDHTWSESELETVRSHYYELIKNWVDFATLPKSHVFEEEYLNRVDWRVWWMTNVLHERLEEKHPELHEAIEWKLAASQYVEEALELVDRYKWEGVSQTRQEAISWLRETARKNIQKPGIGSMAIAKEIKEALDVVEDMLREAGVSLVPDSEASAAKSEPVSPVPVPVSTVSGGAALDAKATVPKAEAVPPVSISSSTASGGAALDAKATVLTAEPEASAPVSVSAASSGTALDTKATGPTAEPRPSVPVSAVSGEKRPGAASKSSAPPPSQTASKPSFIGRAAGAVAGAVGSAKAKAVGTWASFRRTEEPKPAAVKKDEQKTSSQKKAPAPAAEDGDDVKPQAAGFSLNPMNWFSSNGAPKTQKKPSGAIKKETPKEDPPKSSSAATAGAATGSTEKKALSESKSTPAPSGAGSSESQNGTAKPAADSKYGPVRDDVEQYASDGEASASDSSDDDEREQPKSLPVASASGSSLNSPPPAAHAAQSVSTAPSASAAPLVVSPQVVASPQVAPSASPAPAAQLAAPPVAAAADRAALSDAVSAALASRPRQSAPAVPTASTATPVFVPAASTATPVVPTGILDTKHAAPPSSSSSAVVVPPASAASSNAASPIAASAAGVSAGLEQIAKQGEPLVKLRSFPSRSFVGPMDLKEKPELEEFLRRCRYSQDDYGYFEIYDSDYQAESGATEAQMLFFWKLNKQEARAAKYVKLKWPNENGAVQKKESVTGIKDGIAYGEIKLQTSGARPTKTSITMELRVGDKEDDRNDAIPRVFNIGNGFNGTVDFDLKDPFLINSGLLRPAENASARDKEFALFRVQPAQPKKRPSRKQKEDQKQKDGKKQEEESVDTNWDFPLIAQYLPKLHAEALISPSGHLKRLAIAIQPVMTGILVDEAKRVNFALSDLNMTLKAKALLNDFSNEVRSTVAIWNGSTKKKNLNLNWDARFDNHLNRVTNCGRLVLDVFNAVLRTAPPLKSLVKN